MTITTGTNGNETKCLAAIATEWRELPRGTDTAVTLQNLGEASALWLVATGMPSSLDDPHFKALPNRDPFTVKSFETVNHKIYVRAYTGEVSVAFVTR